LNIKTGKQLKNKKTGKQTPADNGRFGAMAAVPRRQFCAKLNVITSQEVQWKPPLRQAALTLCDTRGQRSKKIEVNIKTFLDKIQI